jgi:hypothetical protein
MIHAAGQGYRRPQVGQGKCLGLRLLDRFSDFAHPPLDLFSSVCARRLHGDLLEMPDGKVSVTFRRAILDKYAPEIRLLTYRHRGAPDFARNSRCEH